MAFHQVLVAGANGDASTNYAFELRSLLRRTVDSDIFALNIEAGLEDEVRLLTDFPAARESTDDVIVFHGTIGSPEVFAFLDSRPERVVLVYHNISPAEAYMRYDKAFARLLESGRRDIAKLRKKVVLSLSPSEYNARELLEMGYDDVRVTPLIVDADEMLARQPDATTTTDLAAAKGPLILYVGQLLPHKRIDFLLAAFHVLTTHLLPEARLVLVGRGRVPAYQQHLRTFQRDLQLAGSHFAGGVSDDIRNAYYRSADLFATASEHEGFLVPLIESMAFGVPIVARAFGAIPETLADAGLLLPANDGPTLLAEAMAEMLSSRDVAQKFVARGKRRLAGFDPEDARRDALGHLLSVA